MEAVFRWDVFMCFSAESSFVSAGLLGIIAYASIKKVTSKKQYPLVAMLLFYTGMQIVEGFEWLALESNFFPSFFIPFGAFYFFFVSYFVWPLGMPISLTMVEPDPGRRKKLKGLCIVTSVLILGVMIAKIINPQPPTAQIVNHSIQYSFYLVNGAPQLPSILNNAAPFGVIFVIIFFLSILFSSLKGKWIPCFFTVTSFLLAAYMYNYAFTSVWCFFASTVAASVYILLERNPMQES